MRRWAMAASAGSPPAFRQHGQPGHRRLRLRHPLRARPVPPGPRRWLAGRAAGELAGVRQSLGVRAARGRLSRPLLRHGARGRWRRPGAQASVGGRPARAGGGLRHPRRRLGRQAHQHAAAVVGAKPGPDRPRFVQPRRLYARRHRAGAGAEHQPRPLPERRHRGRAGAAAEAGIFLHHRLACRTSCAGTSRRIRAWIPCPTRWRSSSTTPIQHWRCPS